MLFCKWKHASVIVVSFIYNVGAVADMQYYPPEMQSDLLAAYLAKGKDYQARTANFLVDGTPAYINQLILQD